MDNDAPPQIPEISHTPASPRLDTNDSLHRTTEATRHRGVRHTLARASHLLFPTLHEFYAKNLLGKAVSVFAAPSVFVLTVTLPVVVRSYDISGYRHEKAPSIVNTHSTFEEDGIERTLVAEEESAEIHEMQFNKWLMAVQCAFGPLFVTAVLFSALLYLGFSRPRYLISCTEDSPYV